MEPKVCSLTVRIAERSSTSSAPLVSVDSMRHSPGASTPIGRHSSRWTIPAGTGWMIVREPTEPSMVTVTV